jgi:hypothetical protein
MIDDVTNYVTVGRRTIKDVLEAALITRQVSCFERT